MKFHGIFTSKYHVKEVWIHPEYVMGRSKHLLNIHVITRSVNGRVYKWMSMRIAGGGGMYWYVWLSGDDGMKCPLLSVITWSTKVTWTLDISVWFCLSCCHRILTFHLYISFIHINLCKYRNILVKKPKKPCDLVIMSANLIMIHLHPKYLKHARFVFCIANNIDIDLSVNGGDK